MRGMRFRFVFMFMACYIAVLSLLITEMGQTLRVDTPLVAAAPVIIVDAGHGGFDGGAEGKSGSIEKDINLPIALKVKDLLLTCGYQVIMTRETDTSTCDSDKEGISAKKKSDIMNRFELLSDNPQATLISIHQNKFPDPTQRGAQIFYTPNSEQSKLLAETMQENFKTMLEPQNRRQAKPAEDSVYLMYNSPIPAVLVECGFLSNEAEEARLLDDGYQNKIAFAIAASLMEYAEQGYYPQVE